MGDKTTQGATGKTVKDYLLNGGVIGRVFAYGLRGSPPPAYYRVIDILPEYGDGLVAELEVKHLLPRDASNRSRLNLAVFLNNPEIDPSKVPELTALEEAATCSRDEEAA